MVRIAGAILAVVTISCGAVSAAGAGMLQSTFEPVGGPTLVPYGWADFCVRYKGECDTEPLAATDINLTPKTLEMIQKINLWVNSTIIPESDWDHWGVVDQWDYPTDGYGDCEDYALLKRKLLIERGLPRQALLMTVVKDQNGEGHAILTIKTNHGDFILDNLNNEVKPWTQTGYLFIKRQSQTDPNTWVTLGSPDDIGSIATVH
jgi:predicted transglutaminase-like cysteine proteinase